ncbi:hypothetical protein BG004_005339 [Podila humilis]|nr:hypothetical protein BG004_005339 [Podila humilis]
MASVSQPCQFFNTSKGCRKGDGCRFQHYSTSSSGGASPSAAGLLDGAGPSKPRRKPVSSSATAPTTAATLLSPSLSSSSVPKPRQISRPATVRAPVQRPIPKSLQNVANSKAEAAATLRAFEISQVKSRFGSTFVDAVAPQHQRMISENCDVNEDCYELKIVPSDPDFPYEIEALHVRLHVPKTYPEASCSVDVLNKDIPKGFSTNLERGFNQASSQQKKSLLAHLNWLDVNMEQLLQKPPAATIRFVGHGSNSGAATNINPTVRTSTPPTLSPNPTPPPLPSKASLDSAKEESKTISSSSVTISKPASTPAPPPVVKKVFSAVQIEHAKAQRLQQWNQIQARFRASVETISPTEVQISLEVAQNDMPVKWKGPLWINILVPTLYPLEPCQVRLREDGHNPEIEIWRARNVEEGFRNIVSTMPQLSLFQFLNQLNRDLKDLMMLPEPVAPKPVRTPAPIVGGISHSVSAMSISGTGSVSSSSSNVPTGTGSISTSSKQQLSPPTHSEDRNDRKIMYIERPQRQRNFEQNNDQGALTSEDDDDDDDSEEENEEDSDDANENSGNNDDKDVSEEEIDEEGQEEDTTPKPTDGPATGSISPKRGIEIRMPGLILEHISLLYCRSLNLLVRCNRCKSLIDLPELKPDDSQKDTKVDKRKWKTCDTCQSLLGGHFRTEYIHIQSKTIGYLDLAGCVAYDLLPSTFVPTCAECDLVHTFNQQDITTTAATTASTTKITSSSNNSGDSTSSNLVATTSTSSSSSSPTGFRQKVGRGMSATANCRRCHVRMTFTMEGEIKFVKLSPGDLMKASASTLEQLPLKKKLLARNNNQKLELELKVGEPLPRKGACDHYKKSRRWFRFPCCQKVYPCHLCHDEKESSSHESEYAKRMICGHCSREQPVSDKPCACGESPVKTSNSGSGSFWEGGEGMRDKSRMSNKDSKKHKGANKTVAKKQVGAENVPIAAAVAQVSSAAAIPDSLAEELKLADPYSLPVSTTTSAVRPSATLLKGGTIIAYDDKKKDLDIIRGGDILIVNDRIKAVGQSIKDIPSDAEIVDVSGSIITPGFVDTHRHNWQHVMQTMAPNIGLGDYMYKYGAMGKWTPSMTAEDVYVSTRMSLAASLDGGVTSMLDHGHAVFSPAHDEKMLRAQIESGARVWHAYTPMPVVKKEKYELDWSGMETKNSWQWKQLRDLAKKAPYADGRVQLGLAWDSGRNAEEAKFGFQIAQDLKLAAVTIHDVGSPLQSFGYASKAVYQISEWGFLNSTYPVIFSHGTLVDGADLELLRKYNHFVSVTPESEHHFSHGQLFTHRFMGQSSMGTDTSITYSSDMVTQMRLQLQSTRNVLSRPVHYNSRFVNNTAMTVNQVFLMATRNGGLSMRRPDLGVIMPGAKADLVVFSSDNPSFSAFYDPVAAVVLHSSIRDMQHVMVDGRWVKKDYKLVGLNWPKLKADFEKSARRIQKVLVEIAKDWGSVRAGYFAMTGDKEENYQNVEVVDVTPSVV